jgi:hypothetical protein
MTKEVGGVILWTVSTCVCERMFTKLIYSKPELRSRLNVYMFAM